MYSITEACVKINQMSTEWFNCKYGVKQGDCLSPTLFSLFINDLAKEIKALDKGVKANTLNVSLLMYADDVVFLAETEENLQIMLDTLDNWIKQWGISINNKKSNFVHFRPKKSELTKFKFGIANKPLENVSEYKYLGVYFNEHLDFNTNATTLCQASGRALGGIVSKYKQTNFMGYSTYTKLYENCVIPVMNYCSGVWGYKNLTRLTRFSNEQCVYSWAYTNSHRLHHSMVI